MPAVRKTVPVTTAIDRANHFLEHTDDDQREQRLGVASFLEALLIDANAYSGFSYTEKAGVNHDAIKQGEPFKALDDSRRLYYVHRQLRGN
jgi:hypothetical protein